MRSSPSGGRTLEEEHVPVLLPVQRHVCQDLDELPAVAAHRVERPLELAAIELVLLASQKPVRYHARRVLVGGHAPSLPGRARCRRGPVGAARAARRHRKPAWALRGRRPQTRAISRSVNVAAAVARARGAFLRLLPPGPPRLLRGTAHMPMM